MLPKIILCKMGRTNFHTTNSGWNYFYETASTGKIRVGRYYSNGHVNSNETHSNWFNGDAPANSEQCERLVEQKFYQESR